jgi:PAS domain S-box-containing protein
MPDSQLGKLFELMVERVQDYAIFLLDTSGIIRSWNQGARLIKQYSTDEIVGKHFSVFYTQADIERNWPDQELRRAMLDGRFEDEGWRIRKDGSRFWANVIITALRDNSGTLLGYSKITRDLTARKQEDERLRQSEERFRLLIEGVQDYAIYMLDNQGIVSSWNGGAHRIKGYEASEIIGKHFSRFYETEDVLAGKPWTELAMARDHGRAENEGWRIRKNGSRFWARVVVTALHDAEGKPRGFAKVTQDLTQRQHADLIANSANNLHDFIAVLAHELRNPLAPIRNAVQLLSKSASTDPALEMSRNIIDRQSSQLARIVDDLLDVSRVTRGTLSITKKPTNIADVVSRAVETAQPAIEVSKHSLEVSLPPQLAMVDGDELRLTQALTNLINNAAKYTDPGGSIYVRVTRQTDDKHAIACISVRDTGRGIDPSMLDRIFGLFVQSKDPLNRPAFGLGVGLALARSIVELHHGTLEAESAGIGLGAEFTIKLPMLAAATAGEPVPARVSTPIYASQPGAMAGSRVLIVDDNEDAADVLASLLTKNGHDVQAVHDGIAALDIYESFRPDIVLLDISMPGMNGLELARHIRVRDSNPRPLIVAITGWNQPIDKLRSQEAGFDLHLLKPVEEPELLRLIGTHSRLMH